MTKIQRYEMNHKGLPEPDDNGVWVFREEHDAVVAALQEQAHSTHNDYNKQLCALLPDARYMDPPDGGSVTPMEQVTRMVIDLQEQMQKLAAENVAQRDHCDEVYGAGYQQGHLNTVDGIAYAPGIKDDFYHDALQVMAEVETPATDAVIREIGAKAVEDVADSPDFSLWVKQMLKGHVARIRAGEQL